MPKPMHIQRIYYSDSWCGAQREEGGSFGSIDAAIELHHSLREFVPCQDCVKAVLNGMQALSVDTKPPVRLNTQPDLFRNMYIFSDE